METLQRREFLKSSGALAGAVCLADAAEANGFGGNKNLAVTIRVQADKPRSVLRPIWRFFGADEPNYAYMKDGEKLLGELGELRRGSVYFRAHNLLTSGDGTPALKWGSTGAYREDKQGNPVYNWQIVDRIFDTYLKRGVKPYAQIGFMPRELSRQPEPYQHRWTPGGTNSIFTGWTYPPRDNQKWAELVFQWTSHCVQRYGRAEVESWYWQVWNEPNIGYWRGTPQEFRRLHDTAIDAVRRALPTARVGGPDTAGGGRYLREFLDHCVRGTNYATGQRCQQHADLRRDHLHHGLRRPGHRHPQHHRDPRGPAGQYPVTATLSGASAGNYVIDPATSTTGTMYVVSVGADPTGTNAAQSVVFWDNKGNKSLITAADLSSLDALNLVNQGGAAFDPSAAAQLQAWLSIPPNVTTSYQLALQFAVMDLNVLGGYVQKTDLVYAGSLLAYQTTYVITGLSSGGFISVQNLMNAANAMLALDPRATSGDPNQAYDLALAQVLGAANANSAFVSQEAIWNLFSV